MFANMDETNVIRLTDLAEYADRRTAPPDTRQATGIQLAFPS